MFRNLIARRVRAQESALIELAWGIIANAGGCWEDPEWRQAAERWRDEYHKYLRRVCRPQ